MHVLLTHEQADFDAIASLFGAHLLNEQAVPVLPRRINRNVRAFITLSGADLPFVDPRDIPKDTIEAVTLVDTQSLVTLKGMGKPRLSACSIIIRCVKICPIIGRSRLRKSARPLRS
ncbi:MAG: hypothetical protein L3J16_02260 [Anaerolineales bacterium]|nr:hypothetical protein [Anaerolineales bacterium]